MNNYPATPKKLAYTVDEYCAAHGICRGTLYNLWKRGEGPRWMRVGARRLISVEAHEEYRQRCEQEAVARLEQEARPLDDDPVTAGA
jgi:hypothetical protein